MRKKPAHIPYGQSEAARKFVTEQREKCVVEDPASLRLVDLLAEMLDELNECTMVIAANGGQFTTDRFGKDVVHPAAKQKKAITNEFGKIYRLLGLDQAPQDSQGRLSF